MIRILHIRRSFQAANSYGWSEFISYLQQQSRRICSLHIYFKLVKFKYTQQHIQGSTEPTAAQNAALFTKFSVRLCSLHQVLCCYGYAFICSNISQGNVIWNAWVQIQDAALITSLYTSNAAEIVFLYK